MQKSKVLHQANGAGDWPVNQTGLPIAVLGVAASYERHRITERTTVGRAQAKARGVKFGRRAALTPHQQAEALQRLAAGDTQRTVAALLGVNQATISRLHRNITG